MTHSAKIIAASILIIVSFFSNTHAQQIHGGASEEPIYVKNSIGEDIKNDSKTTRAANAKIESRFTAMFPNASQLLWTAGTDNYWVSFLNNDRNARASFTPKGKMNYLITDCEMQHLPAAFSKTIAEEYATYRLFKAIEVKAYGALVYQAIMENSTQFTTLKYTIDGVEEIQELKKQ